MKGVGSVVVPAIHILPANLITKVGPPETELPT